MSAALSVCPLGGCGEIGLNATLLQSGQDRLLIDCGAQFGSGGAAVDRLLPDLSALSAPGGSLKAVLLTHGHEDHIGALPALLSAHKVPVYGSRYTLMMVRARLEGGPKADLRELSPGAAVSIGPFEVEPIQVSHSIPQALALSILSPAGRVVHSGDFRLDSTAAEPTDVARLKALGEQGVLLLMSDSTNAERAHTEPHEAEVHAALAATLSATEGRTVISLVSSHVHRIAAITQAARKQGKRISLLGRSLSASWQRGVRAGLLPNDPSLLVDPDALHRHPRGRVLLLSTGAQGEWQGGLHRITQAAEGSPLALQPGDQVILSARVIPGSERAVRGVHNHVLQRGARFVNDRMAPVHCSGHASPADQAALIRWLRPRHFIPIHGDRAMLEAHAQIARAAEPAPQVHLLENGARAWLEGGALSRLEALPHGSLPLDRSGAPLSWREVRARAELAREGVILLQLLRGPRGQLASPPQLKLLGLSEPEGLREELSEQLLRVFSATLQREQLGEEELRRQLQPIIRRRLGGKPRLVVQLLQV